MAHHMARKKVPCISGICHAILSPPMRKHPLSHPHIYIYLTCINAHHNYIYIQLLQWTIVIKNVQHIYMVTIYGQYIFLQFLFGWLLYIINDAIQIKEN